MGRRVHDHPDVGRRAGKGDLMGGAVKIDYRPVHEFTLTDDVEYIKPKKRVY